MTARFTLYGHWASGPTYKVALMLRLSGTPFDYVHVDLLQGAHKQPDYLVNNRYGSVPTLRDDEAGFSLAQSGAALEYLAEVTGELTPTSPADRARAVEWLFWGWDKLARGVYRSRGYKFGFAKAADDVKAHYSDEGVAALRDLDAHLNGRDWLAGPAASFADVDLYGVVTYAPQGGLDLTGLPNLNAWTARVEALPRFLGPQDLLPKESLAA